MKVCVVSSEVFPFSKTGGLADVAGSLPKALKNNGVDVCVLSPRYKSTDKFDIKTVGQFEVNIGSRTEEYYLGKYENGIEYYFIGNDYYFKRDFLYNDGTKDYDDNAERFSLFSMAALDTLKHIDFKPDIIHVNDWQTSLVAIYKKLYYQNDDFLNRSKTLLTIHNIGYQGLFEQYKMEKLGLPYDIFNIEGIEFYGKINLLKGGIIFSDFVNTVSKTYAQEIQKESFGAGLDGLLRSINYKLTGIVNGIDNEYWNPESDSTIYYKYSAKNIEKKNKNKEELKKELKLAKNDAPLFGMVSRMATQKGLDILIEAIKKLFKNKGQKAQFVFLGTGDRAIEEQLISIKKQHTGDISANIKFDEELAHKIYAASDFFLMPSLYEPCGLGQLIAYRYGTIPVVRATGGLKDTVKSLTKSKNGTGFIFNSYSEDALLKQMVYAANKFFSDRQLIDSVRHRIMELDYSWENQSKQYIKLYKKIIA